MTTIPGYTTLKNLNGHALYIDTATYELLNRLLDLGSNIFLFGPAGVAKTEVAHAVFTERGLTSFQAEFGAVSSGDQLDGMLTLDKEGKMTLVPSELYKAIRSAASGTKTGLIADELNRVQGPSALNKLLRLFGSQKEYATDLDGVFKVGDNLSTIATANIGFYGTTRLNEALLDRLDALEMKPITGRVLQTMLEERFPTVDVKQVSKVVSFSDSVLKLSQNDPDGDLRPISTRDAQRITRGIAAGLSPIESVTRLVGGQLMIQQRGAEAVEALTAQANGKLK